VKYSSSLSHGSETVMRLDCQIYTEIAPPPNSLAGSDPGSKNLLGGAASLAPLYQPVVLRIVLISCTRDIARILLVGF